MKKKKWSVDVTPGAVVAIIFSIAAYSLALHEKQIIQDGNWLSVGLRFLAELLNVAIAAVIGTFLYGIGQNLMGTSENDEGHKMSDIMTRILGWSIFVAFIVFTACKRAGL